MVGHNALNVAIVVRIHVSENRGRSLSGRAAGCEPARYGFDHRRPLHDPERIISIGRLDTGGKMVPKMVWHRKKTTHEDGLICATFSSA